MTDALDKRGSTPPRASMLPSTEAELRAATRPRARASAAPRSLTPYDLRELALRRARRRRDIERWVVQALTLAVALWALWGVTWLIDSVDGHVGEIPGEVQR